MNRDEYLILFRQYLDRMYETTKRKNSDYTGATGDDPFSNFTRVEALGIARTGQGFLTRMLDKFMRITTFEQKGELLVKDESVEDTLIDLAAYSLLFAAYIKSTKITASPRPTLDSDL